ncbi:anti-sigma factor family protein [Tengunoibacter tsumagoiensis]|uniref:Zinc-finger domain-containing protein n=1 Tax=Tengunoibacter tsumagoiensis TaxID=2014871 RepID=A0A402A2I3_9CHLR|nr:zf-HC2 domain-containing protein [Tengunoibacter tsumagoiensis]GCE13266.1 hypothetical protein KTT_31250 [Tengunoibacter tsumagoiensis]
MNCSQARALLAIYRELNKDQTTSSDATELDVHLAHCAACREAYAQYHSIGERIRALPPIEPSPTAHTKLMQALAAEHARFLERAPSSVSSTPAPAFLAPYLKELAQKDPDTKSLAAFATAETGPLPIIRPIRRRQPWHMNQFMTIGLAASILMVLMVGGVTGLLTLANQGSSLSTLNKTTTSIHSAQISASEPYATTSTYPYVASAIAGNDAIYYTNYNASKTNWMLEQFDIRKNSSQLLLTVPVGSPLILLGTSKDWLLWLQFDEPKAADTKHVHPDAQNVLPRTWSVHVKALGTDASSPNNADLTLVNGTFNPDTVPNWVRSPVQGVSFTQNTILLAMVDERGTSHLLNYPLDKTAATQANPIELAHAEDGHILASPTSNMDGTDIYWADEWWVNGENALHSNIWTQQIQEAIPERQGRWAAHMQTYTYLFRSDERSFKPQVVEDMLFFLQTDGSTSNQAKPTATPTAQSTSIAQATVTASPISINANSVLGGTVKYDPGVYAAQIDAQASGKLQTYSANGALQLPTTIDDNKIVSAIQGGKRFLLWQNSANAFEMYDVETKAPVTIDSDTVPKNASFLNVNGDTAVWVINTLAPNTTDQSDPVNPTIKLGTFKWPRPIKGSTGP